MLSALAFLTIVGRPRGPESPYVPLVRLRGSRARCSRRGRPLGRPPALAAAGCRRWLPPLVAAAVALAADLLLTGALHLDGPWRTRADGLGAQVERARRLELMAKPGIGAFALAAGGTVLVTRWALLADPDIEFLAFVGIWAASRILAADSARLRQLRPTRPGWPSHSAPDPAGGCRLGWHLSRPGSSSSPERWGPSPWASPS